MSPISTFYYFRKWSTKTGVLHYRKNWSTKNRKVEMLLFHLQIQQLLKSASRTAEVGAEVSSAICLVEVDPPIRAPHPLSNSPMALPKLRRLVRCDHSSLLWMTSPKIQLRDFSAVFKRPCRMALEPESTVKMIRRYKLHFRRRLIKILDFR